MTTPLESFRWIHGSPDCAQSRDPLIQVFRFDADSFILRISKCFSFEANFLYLLIGEDRAVLFDTSGRPDPQAAGQVLPLRATVDALLDTHARSPHPGGMELVVAHTHSHGDHIQGDHQFADRPRTTVVGHGLAEVQAFWGLGDWPEGSATFDLGRRPLTIFPIPGHEPTHMAIHDPRTGILLTGDVLYPGLLTVRDWPAFRASTRRLAEFARRHPVNFVLGNHVEMSRTPGRLHPPGATWQPDEHPLPLTAAPSRSCTRPARRWERTPMTRCGRALPLPWYLHDRNRNGAAPSGSAGQFASIQAPRALLRFLAAGGSCSFECKALARICQPRSPGSGA